jgi:DNA-directed RNA polymerase III subunit RPC1
VDRELATKKFTNECTAAYIATIRGFIADSVAHHLAKIRKARGMFEALERYDEWDADTDLSMGATSVSPCCIATT